MEKRETGLKKKKKTSGSHDREGRKTKETRHNSRGMMCARARDCAPLPRLLRGGRLPQWAGSILPPREPCAPGGSSSNPVAVAVAGPGLTPAANALRSCQLGPFLWPPPHADPPQSSRSPSRAGVPFWVTCREVSLTP